MESLRVVTPAGVIESRRLPGSGAGPSPDRLFIGSEGILGVITEAWMRLQDRPTLRASASVTFPDLERGAAAARAIAQAALYPANCRLLDPGEAMTAGAGDGSTAVLIVGFESADHALDAWMSARSSVRATTAVRFHPTQAVRAPPPKVDRPTPPAHGARRSSTRRISATCSSAWA